MQSFRHELEDLNNPIVEKDIIELANKIQLFKEGKIDEEKFRSLRLARGVYGQRQQGVQMIRIKLPYGKISPKQLIRIADVSDKYSNGNLHTTTRQDVQLHFVSLDDTPELWAELEKDDITLREACGNTVRNITASYTAGIDAKEPFDVSPYAEALFQYLLRNAPGQELGRKIKIAFSSSDEDTAFTFLHDIGFIPRVIVDEDGKEIRGFKIVIGGGLGAQPFLAQTAHEFLHEDFIIPFTDALIRVFDRYGERSKRNKARLKYLLNDLGIEKLLELVEEEKTAVGVESVVINKNQETERIKDYKKNDTENLDIEQYDKWLKANIREQKQRGLFSVGIKLTNGNLSSFQARELAKLVTAFASDDFRITPNQGIQLRFVIPQNLPTLFTALSKIGLANIGFSSTGDITSCPGTDTCNLGITNSTSFARALEKTIKSEYADLLFDSKIQIKISGCMNSCGQHAIANIGFHGSTIKSEKGIVPAIQILLGGGVLGEGKGAIADKVIKIPTRRGVDALRIILDNYEDESENGEYFNDFYQRKGKNYFYDLLKPLADVKEIKDEELLDWGSDKKYTQAIGVGECAGVVIDLVTTLLLDAEEKRNLAHESFLLKKYKDSIYHSYATLISTAKTYLISKGEKTNSHEQIIEAFDLINEEIELETSFKSIVEQIKLNPPNEIFAQLYLYEADNFLDKIKENKKKNELTKELIKI